MKENRQFLSERMPIWAYLIILIFFALGVTSLATMGKGWDSRKFEEAVQQAQISEKTPAVRDIPENIRPAAAAGLFYPAEPQKLYTEVSDLLSSSPPLELRGVRAILVPHAGYEYSGDVAAAAFREVAGDFKRVFILAANHNGEVNFKGVSLPQSSHYAIPGASLALDRTVDELLADQLFVQEPPAHTKYVIEVELPFLYALKKRPEPPDFTIIPMIVGQMDNAAIARLAEVLNSYADPKTLFVFSVDLSHFYNDAKARQLDSFTLQSILSRDHASLTRTTADGPQVLLTMIRLAELNGWDSTLLRYKNSGEVSGDPSRVVGYGAIAFHEPLSLSRSQQNVLLQFARTTIEEYLETGDSVQLDPDVLGKNPILRIPRGVFVTLKKNGELRGCIGDIFSTRPLHEGIRFCAIRSAVKDARFKPVVRQELEDITVSISVLDFPKQITVDTPLDYPKVLRPGKDGVIMVHQGKRSTFLPDVWHDIPSPVEFLSRLCSKQKSPPDCWQDSRTALFRYGSLYFAEENGHQ